MGLFCCIFSCHSATAFLMSLLGVLGSLTRHSLPLRFKQTPTNISYSKDRHVEKAANKMLCDRWWCGTYSQYLLTPIKVALFSLFLVQLAIFRFFPYVSFLCLLQIFCAALHSSCSFLMSLLGVLGSLGIEKVLFYTGHFCNLFNNGRLLFCYALLTPIFQHSCLFNYSF